MANLSVFKSTNQSVISFFSRSECFFFDWRTSHIQCFPYHSQKSASRSTCTLLVFILPEKHFVPHCGIQTHTHTFFPLGLENCQFSIQLRCRSTSNRIISTAIPTKRGRKRIGFFCIDPILKRAKNPLIAWIYFITISIFLPFAQKPNEIIEKKFKFKPKRRRERKKQHTNRREWNQ